VPDLSYTIFGGAPLARHPATPDHGGEQEAKSGPQSRKDAEGNRAVDGGQRVPRFAPQLIV